jgi:hypothetical protein
MNKERSAHLNQQVPVRSWEQIQEAERQRRLTRLKKQGFEAGKAYGLQEKDRQVVLKDDGDFYRVSDSCPIYNWVATNPSNWWIIRFFYPTFDAETGKINGVVIPFSFFQEMGP